MSSTKPRSRKRKSPSTTTTTTTTTLSSILPAISSALSDTHSFLLRHELLLLPRHSLLLESSLLKIHSSLSKLPHNNPFPPATSDKKPGSPTCLPPPSTSDITPGNPTCIHPLPPAASDNNNPGNRFIAATSDYKPGNPTCLDRFPDKNNPGSGAWFERFRSATSDGDPGIGTWFERFRAATSDGDIRWVETFRMSAPTFRQLSSLLAEQLTSAMPSVPPDCALGACLYRLAHNASFCSVGRRFGLTSADSCRAFYAVIKAICKQLGGNLGRFGSEMDRIVLGFERISLPNCCGVLGLERIRVCGDVLGKDGFLMVQGLVDSDGRFLDVSAGWPSTFSPGSIFPQTRLFSSVENSKELLNGSPYEFSDGDLLNQYVLGEACYPLLPWLLTPYVGKKDEELGFKEMEFNYVHGLSIGCVRTAFRRVRANWGLLDRRWKEESVEFLPFVVVAACLLNNFLLENGEKFMDEELDCVEEEGGFEGFEGEASEEGLRSRDLLAMHLSWVSQRR